MIASCLLNTESVSLRQIHPQAIASLLASYKAETIRSQLCWNYVLSEENLRTKEYTGEYQGT